MTLFTKENPLEYITRDYVLFGQEDPNQIIIYVSYESRIVNLGKLQHEVDFQIRKMIWEILCCSVRNRRTIPFSHRTQWIVQKKITIINAKHPIKYEYYNKKEKVLLGDSLKQEAIATIIDGSSMYISLNREEPLRTSGPGFESSRVSVLPQDADRYSRIRLQSSM